MRSRSLTRLASIGIDVRQRPEPIQFEFVDPIITVKGL
jgi:hypothetical protein